MHVDDHRARVDREFPLGHDALATGIYELFFRALRILGLQLFHNDLDGLAVQPLRAAGKA